MHTRRFLAPLAEITSDAQVQMQVAELGNFRVGGECYTIPRVSLRGQAGGGDTVRLGIFAAIHGDEPAGALALREFVLEAMRSPDLLLGYALEIYPVCNPSGFQDGTRHNRAGRDLNREFWRGSDQPEVHLLERELGVRQFHGLVALHSDDTTAGVYAYARGAVLTEALVVPALRAAAEFLPVSADCIIDGFPAAEGIIRHHCYDGVLANPSEVHPAPFEIIFETPQKFALDLQVRATVAALRSILGEYRVLTSIGGEL